MLSFRGLLNAMVLYFSLSTTKPAPTIFVLVTSSPIVIDDELAAVTIAT